MAVRKSQPAGEMDSLVRGAGLSVNATQTILTHAANMPPEKREAILRRLQGILSKYMTLSEVVLDDALKNPRRAGKSFLSSMGKNILEILVGFVTLDETKQQHLRASMTVGDREELHKILGQLQGDKAKLGEMREAVLGELAALRQKELPAQGEVVEAEVADE